MQNEFDIPDLMGITSEVLVIFLLACAFYLLVSLLHVFGLLLQRKAQSLCFVSQLCLQGFQCLIPSFLTAPLFPLPQQIQAEGSKNSKLQDKKK